MPAKYKFIYKNGQPGIKCQQCKMVSFHPKDIENRYCANCAIFYEQYQPTKKDIAIDVFLLWLLEHGFEFVRAILFTVFMTLLTVWQVRHNQLAAAIGLTFINLFALGYCREGDGRRQMINEFQRANQDMVKEAKALFDLIEKKKKNGWQADQPD